MLRDEDESSGIDCPVCHRTFSTFARMDDHLAEHEGPKKCRQCFLPAKRFFYEGR